MTDETTPAGNEPDLIDCRLTVVPAIGVYSINKDSNKVRSPRVGIRVSAITCQPLPDDGEDDLGVWSASHATLQAMIDSHDRGPLSGVEQEYTDKKLVSARQRLLLTSRRLLGAAEGQTAWGASGEGKVGRIVVWQWNFDRIHEIKAYRIKKMMKMWDAGLEISCTEPRARFEFSALGPDSHVFNSRSDKAKAAAIDKSDVLGFATLLANLSANATGRTVTRSSNNDSKEPVETFRLM